MQSGKSGTPIISLNVNPDSFLDKFSCGFHSQNNISKLESDLNYLVSDKELWRNQSKNIKHYVNKFHNHKMIIKKLKTFLKGM